MKTRVTTNQKHTINSQKNKKKELRHYTEENHQTTKGKTKRKIKEQRRNTKSTGKQGLNNKYTTINNYLKCHRMPIKKT